MKTVTLDARTGLLLDAIGLCLVQVSSAQDAPERRQAWGPRQGRECTSALYAEPVAQVNSNIPAKLMLVDHSELLPSATWYV